ncbi:YitT family protein [Lactobacillus bombi]|nr:YitT family protein [Bombilactobacillus bombi]
MIKIRQNLYMKKITRLFSILAGLELIALSVSMFFEPHKIAAGGATGLAILVKELFNIQLSWTLLAFNLVMWILTIIFLDKVKAARITFGSLVLPIFLAITPNIMVIKDPLLSDVIGSILFGLGLSIIYRFGSSAGGTTVPPMILNKYFRIRNADSLFVIDGIVCLGNILVSGWEQFFLAILSVGISTIVLNYVQTGIDKKLVVYIMSEKHLEPIKSQLAENLKAGSTVFEVRGGHSNQPKEMLMLVTDTQNYGNILDIVFALDPEAFILADSIAEVHNGHLKSANY